MPLPRILVRILLDCRHMIMWLNFIFEQMQVKWTSGKLEQYKQFIQCSCHAVDNFLSTETSIWAHTQSPR